MKHNSFFQYVVVYKFFTEFAPQVKNWQKKITGKDGNGQPLDFSDQDKLYIEKAKEKFAKKLFKH